MDDTLWSPGLVERHAGMAFPTNAYHCPEGKGGKRGRRKSKLGMKEEGYGLWPKPTGWRSPCMMDTDTRIDDRQKTLHALAWTSILGTMMRMQWWSGSFSMTRRACRLQCVEPSFWQIIFFNQITLWSNESLVVNVVWRRGERGWSLWVQWNRDGHLGNYLW